MDILKPCPFCGGEAELKRTQIQREYEIDYCCCKKCGAMGEMFSIQLNRIPPRVNAASEIFKPVRDAWNRRNE